MQNLLQGFSVDGPKPPHSTPQPCRLGAPRPPRRRRTAQHRREGAASAQASLGRLCPCHPRLSHGRPQCKNSICNPRAPGRQHLVQFFQNNPDLELIKNNIPSHLAAQGEKAFAGIGADQQAAVDTARGVSARPPRLARSRCCPDTPGHRPWFGNRPLGLSSSTSKPPPRASLKLKPTKPSLPLRSKLRFRRVHLYAVKPRLAGPLAAGYGRHRAASDPRPRPILLSPISSDRRTTAKPMTAPRSARLADGCAAKGADRKDRRRAEDRGAVIGFAVVLRSEEIGESGIGGDGLADGAIEAADVAHTLRPEAQRAAVQLHKGGHDGTVALRSGSEGFVGFSFSEARCGGCEVELLTADGRDLGCRSKADGQEGLGNIGIG